MKPLDQLRQGKEILLGVASQASMVAWSGDHVASTVARQAGCAESLVSYVENGRRQLQPWLAELLDAVYRTDGAISALASGADRVQRVHADTEARPGLAEDDVILVRLPEGGVTIPVSRRELLAG